MFKEIGQFTSLMKNLPKMQEQAMEMQGKLEKITAQGDAGAGLVAVKVNGKFEMLSCRISDDAWKMQDRDCLEELIRGATNQAMAKVRAQIAEETGKLAQSLGLPGGFQLPGMG